MRGLDDNELRAWLEAEAAGAEDDADRRFASIFRAVPKLAPRPGIADTVISRLGLRPVFVPPVLPAWARVGVLALLGLGGTAAAAFWSTWIFDLFAAGRTLGPRVLIVAMTAIGWALDAGQHAWLAVAAISRALAVAASTGPAAAAIAANLTVAFLAALALRRLLPAQEE